MRGKNKDTVAKIREEVDMGRIINDVRAAQRAAALWHESSKPEHG